VIFLLMVYNIIDH